MHSRGNQEGGTLEEQGKEGRRAGKGWCKGRVRKGEAKRQDNRRKTGETRERRRANVGKREGEQREEQKGKGRARRTRGAEVEERVLLKRGDSYGRHLVLLTLSSLVVTALF